MRFRLLFAVLLCGACLLAAGCGVAGYNERYDKQLQRLADLLQPEQNRTPFASGSIRMPLFIDGNAKIISGLPEEIHLPFPAQFQFGYEKALPGAKPEEIQLAIFESDALKGDLIEKGVPAGMRAIAPENPEVVQKLELKSANGKALPMYYYAGTLKILTDPNRPGSPKIEKKIALYFVENGGKTLAAAWIASPGADGLVHFFDAARQSMNTLVYDPNAKPPAQPAPPAAGAAAPAGQPAAAPK